MGDATGGPGDGRPEASLGRAETPKPFVAAPSAPEAGADPATEVSNARPVGVRRPRRYLHWPRRDRQLHLLAIILVPFLLATGLALYYPAVHGVLIPYLPVIYKVHIAAGLLWLAVLLVPVVSPPKFHGRRTLSTWDWFPLLALGVGAAITGIALILPALFSAAVRGFDFDAHGLIAAVLAAAVLIHAFVKWVRLPLKKRFVPERGPFLKWALTGVFGALALPYVARAGTGTVEAFTSPGGASPFASGGFITYSAAGFIPEISRDRYRLTVAGDVDAPYTLTYDELATFSPVTRDRNFQCVTGWVVADVHWKGVRLADLVERARPRPSSKPLVVRFFSADGVYTDTLSGSQVDLGDVLLAFEKDGKPLSADRGGPVRLVVPPMYGYKSVKWVDRIEVVHEVTPGYWEVRGYPVNAWISDPL